MRCRSSPEARISLVERVSASPRGGVSPFDVAAFASDLPVDCATTNCQICDGRREMSSNLVERIYSCKRTQPKCRRAEGTHNAIEQINIDNLYECRCCVTCTCVHIIMLVCRTFEMFSFLKLRYCAKGLELYASLANCVDTINAGSLS